MRTLDFVKMVEYWPWMIFCERESWVWVWVYWCFTLHATIFQSYMWRHRCAGGLRKKLLYLRSGSQRHKHFAGFFNVPVLHRHGTNLFIQWFRHTAPLVTFYDTLLGIRGTYSRLNPPPPGVNAEVENIRIPSFLQPLPSKQDLLEEI